MKDSGQLTFQTMGGDTVVVPVRGKHYVQPRGYVSMPGTGPAGETCKTCQHIVRMVRARAYLKCDLNRARWTHGGASDIRANSPACNRWEQVEPQSSTAVAAGEN